MTDKGLSTTVQESKGKYTTPIPTALVNLLGIEKGNKTCLEFKQWRNHLKGCEGMTKDIEGELYHLDKMITSLVEILEENGIRTYDEWEVRIRKKIEDSKGLTKFEELED